MASTQRVRDSHSLFGLAGATVLVSGAAGGIGVGLVTSFLEQNCNVCAHVHSAASGDQLRERLSVLKLPEGWEERLKVCIAELASRVAADAEEQVRKMFESAETAFKAPVQVLIANHAVFEPSYVEMADMSLEQFETTLDVNLTGVFLLCKYFLRGLRAARDKGKLPYPLQDEVEAIVLVGSTAGKFGEAGHADYAASKSALMFGMSRSLKNEIVKIAPRGRVNVVAPGWTKTTMAAAAVSKGEHFHALQTTPLRKIAEVDDVVNAVLFLASPLSAHTTGGIIEIDGGMEGRVLNSLDSLRAPASELL